MYIEKINEYSYEKYVFRHSIFWTFYQKNDTMPTFAGGFLGFKSGGGGGGGEGDMASGPVYQESGEQGEEEEQSFHTVMEHLGACGVIEG